MLNQALKSIQSAENTGNSSNDYARGLERGPGSCWDFRQCLLLEEDGVSGDRGQLLCSIHSILVIARVF